MDKIVRMIKNKSKPTFKRQEQDKMKKLSAKWKKPRGTDSSMRRKARKRSGHPVKSLRTAKVIRGLHPSGLAEVIVHNISELPGKDVVIRIAGNVGKRKRADIVKVASEKGLKLLNGGMK